MSKPFFTNLGVPKVDEVVVLPPKGFLLASAALGVDPSPLKNPPPPPPEPPENSNTNYKFESSVTKLQDNNQSFYVKQKRF